MKSKLAAALVCVVAASFAPENAMAQNESSTATRWLEKADLAPAFNQPKSKSAWEKQRRQIRAQLWQLLGKLPPRPKTPKVEAISKQDRGEYLLEKFQFDNGAGAIVPGCVLLPKTGSGKRPAILYCHWHGGEYEIGKEELFQAKHTPEPPGPAFARRGFVVLGIDAYCFGERNGNGVGEPKDKGGQGEMNASKFNLWVGRTLWGMMLRDDLMALDYLVSRPEVDPDRVAVTGMSMGATRSWWLMALDDRIKTGVAIACLTRYRNLIEHQSLPAHGIYYFVPGMLNHFDTEAVLALSAPRAILLMNGDEDDGSPADGIHAIEAAVRPVYALYGKEDAFQSFVYRRQGHVYTPEMWAKTMDWFSHELGAGAR